MGCADLTLDAFKTTHGSAGMLGTTPVAPWGIAATATSAEAHADDDLRLTFSKRRTRVQKA